MRCTTNEVSGKYLKREGSSERGIDRSHFTAEYEKEGSSEDTCSLVLPSKFLLPLILDYGRFDKFVS